MLFLCSPGNPTSKVISLSDIELIAQNPKAQNLIIVVDEAYIDFATTTTTSNNGDNDNGNGNNGPSSAVSLINKYSNIVVLQTLSKAFGLAAIRCGFCLGPADIIQLMNNVKAPYNVNALTSEMALKALDRQQQLQANIDLLLEQRTYVATELTKLDFVVQVYPSDANFLLVELKSHSKQVYQNMADHAGVVVRYRGSEIHCNECLRITIGTPDENKAFLKAIQKTYQSIIMSKSTTS